MGTITALLVALSFVTGCVTLVVGYQVGHGETPLVTHLSWAMGTLLLQFAAACIAVMHARAERRYVSSLEKALEAASLDVESGGSA
ncbi:MAG: hypothetical protein P8R42_13260 [Candidatus Binatia bacterium]|nr:hypothetical protein [Candidatus Binatia bacterium]